MHGIRCPSCKEISFDIEGESGPYCENCDESFSVCICQVPKDSKDYLDYVYEIAETQDEIDKYLTYMDFVRSIDDCCCVKDCECCKNKICNGDRIGDGDNEKKCSTCKYITKNSLLGDDDLTGIKLAYLEGFKSVTWKCPICYEERIYGWD